MPYPDRFYPVVDSVAWVARLAALGVGEVFLAEMQVLCAGDDRRAPVVVDHEFRIGALDGLQSVGHDLQRL